MAQPVTEGLGVKRRWSDPLAPTLARLMEAETDRQTTQRVMEGGTGGTSSSQEADP